MSKQQELEAQLEATREELAELVAKKELDLEQGYYLLHKIQELSKERDKLGEVEYALGILRAHGVAFKVFTEEDVWRRVRQLPLDLHSMPKIVKHVVEGDDWDTMTVELAEEDANIWSMIKGTAGDHPEWFTEEALEKL